MIGFFTGDGVANQSVAFGTRIQFPLFGGFGFTHLVNFRYTDGGTAHTITAMRGASRSIAAGAVLAAATLLTTNDKLVDGAGNDIATSDVICAQLDDGSWHQTTVSSLSTDKKGITMNNAVPTGRTIKDRAKVINYGVAGDAMHAKYQFTSGSGSAAVNFPAVTGSVLSMCKATDRDEPIVMDSNNATATGMFNYTNAACTMQ